MKFLTKILILGIAFHSQPCISLAEAANDTLWIESWENPMWGNDWHVDFGTWQVGGPSSGPGAAYRGGACAATVLAGNYANDVSSRLIRHTPFVVPSALEHPRLRFWQWFGIGLGDEGFVQVRVLGDSLWNTVEGPYVGSCSGVWSYTSIDLSAYANQAVELAFLLQSNCCSEDVGWYIDDVAVVAGSPIFNNPEGWEAGIGDWSAGAGTWEIGTPTSGPNSAYLGTTCAATVLAGSYSADASSRMVSPVFVVPSGLEHPRLRFWQWYGIGFGDGGFVQVRALEDSLWNTVGGPYVGSSSGVWSYTSLDLLAYTDQAVELAFLFQSNCCSEDAGWYIDDVAVISQPGDCVFDGVLTSADIICLVNCVFRGGPCPDRSGDTNCNGLTSSSDIIVLVNHVFRGSPTPTCIWPLHI